MNDDAYWLDDLHPHDPERSQAQVDGLLELLGPPPKRVLDLGCGTGRTLVPLAAAGYDVVGVDRDAGALELCKARLAAAHASAELIHADFMTMPSPARQPLDAILCLGNTWMTLVDVDQAVDLLVRIRTWLCDGGVFMIDDFPYELWPELTDGNWQTGISEDGSMQLVWKQGDAVFALRRGQQIDPESLEPKPGDRLLRLWCMGSISLAARAAGLSAPVHLPQMALMVMRCAPRAVTA